MDEIKINVFNIVGYADCTLPEDGDKVYKILERAILENKKALISFKNVDRITSAFLNNAIGKLYGNFEDTKLKESLAIEEMSNSGKILLKRVISTAKAYFKNPDKMRESIKKILGEDDEQKI
ncbi:MAG: STAS-like domain-containing protein [Arcobacteraceae bacterium]